MEAKGCKKAKAFIGAKKPVRLARNCLNLTAKTLVCLITGQAVYHRFITGTADNPDCRFCRMEEETTKHVLREYEAVIKKYE